MRLLQYEEIGNKTIVGLIFDDDTMATAIISDNKRPKKDILKDAYIILRNRPKEPFTGKRGDYEIFHLEKRVPTRMDVNCRSLYGTVYDQYGDKMDIEITYTVEGEAKIEDGRLIENEVKEPSTYTVRASVGDLEEIEVFNVFPKPPEPPKRLSEVEILQAKVKVLEEKSDFKDDLIQELALIVYGGMDKNENI